VVTQEFGVHREPVWRDRANFIISAALPEKETPQRFEQLWARHLSDDQFEVCCIPFFVYDVALGDVVRAVPRGDRNYVMEQVVEPSGRYAFRVWFGDSTGSREQIASELLDRGALLEWSSETLLGVDASDAAHAKRIADYLQDREDANQLVYETGRSR
jgi:hypothetical protein